jgi:hypothetical protein
MKRATDRAVTPPVEANDPQPGAIRSSILQPLRRFVLLIGREPDSGFRRVSY